VLGGFYRYAFGRGFATISPLPKDTPKPPAQLTPHIYTVDELKRLLAATEILQTPLSPLLALTMRTLLLLLYGTGMRIGETLSLTLQQSAPSSPASTKETIKKLARTMARSWSRLFLE
jgi:integrase/recombinase XerD